MLLLVLRTVALYAAAAVVTLGLAHRFVQPLRLRVAILLAALPGLLTGGALLTGGVYAPLDIAYGSPPLAAHRSEMRIPGTRTGLLSDVVAQYIPARRAVRDALEHGRLPLWNRFHMLGEPLLGFLQPAVLHPNTWLGLALPLPQAWTFDLTLRLLLAVVSAYLYFRDLGCGEVPSLFGAVGWAFCDHVVFFLGYSVGAAVVAFPLLLLGLRRLMHRSDRSAVALTVASLCLITVAGHPETLLHAVAGAGVSFLFELASAGRGRRLRPVLLSLVAGGLTLGLCAVVLLPFLEILPHTQQASFRAAWWAIQKKSVTLPLSLYRSVRNLLPFALGLRKLPAGDEALVLPAAYAGALVYPLAALGLWSRRREKWAFLALALAGLAIWARLAGVTDLVSRIPLFDLALNEYLVFLAAFGTVALAVLGVEALFEGRQAAAFALGAFAFSGVLVAVYRFVRPQLMAMVVESPGRRHLLLQLGPLLLAAVLALALRRAGGPVVALAVLLVFVTDRAVETGAICPTFEARAFYPPLPVLDGIPRRAPERVVASGVLFEPDASALYGVEDARAYGAMTLGSLRETYPLWCVDQPVWFNRVDDVTRPFLSFLNVRYAVVPVAAPAVPGWKELGEGSGVRLLENPGALPRAFVPRRLRFEADASRQNEALASIEDFGEEGIVGTGGPDAGSANGEAAVRIDGYSGQEMSLHVEARGTAIVATSIPAWPGWKLTLDGVRAPLLPYNRAFLGFRVPPGTHAAHLFYLPDGFLRGAAVSIGTLILSGWLLARRGRSRIEAEGVGRRAL